MPHQDSSGPAGPTVRRAVSMPGTVADPDSALRPRAARKDAKETKEVNKAEEANGTKESTKTTGPAGSKTAAEPVKGDEPKKAAEPETVSAATVAATVKSSSGKTSSEPASSAAKRSDEHGDADVGSLVAAAGGNPPGSTSESDGGEGGDKPPSGRPTKALLAAAGIGGALLIAIPFLVAGTNSKDDSEPAALARKTSAHTMPANDEDKAPGAYAPKSPDKPKPTPEDKSKAPKSPAKPSPSAAEKQKEEKKSAPAPKKSKKVSPKRAVAPVDFSNKKNVLLRNAVTGKCADIPGYGKGEVDGKIQQYDCDGTSADNQVWNFEVRYKGKGPGSANLFQIRNVKDGYCMDLPYYGGADHGQEVTEFHCDGTTNDNQLWWLESRGDKKFWIHNYASNQQCLAIKADRGSTDPSAKLAIGPCRSDRNHEWTF
ncbi:RICIN domain-containing protein [Streptomyces sp. NPDC019937]|uniref:RICIN domain-containing protein n=1 Tax=Streptomyces sp. NPDC019937 TaxID=3154787 RepID=UPI0034094A85